MIEELKDKIIYVILGGLGATILTLIGLFN